MDPVALPPESPDPSFRDQLLLQADALAAGGQEQLAAQLRQATEAWWRAEEEWRARLAGVLRLHHDINNALVGVRGNAQLLMMGPAGDVPGVRDRLEVVIRETGKIQEAAGRLRELKSKLTGPPATDRAA